MGNKPWSTHEIHIIQKGFHRIPDFILASKLPGRSVLAIAQKRRNMGLKYVQEWMNEKING